MKRVVFAVAAVAILGIAAVILIGAAQPAPISAELINLQSLNNAAGFSKADHPRAFTFPADHGPHPEYQTEWWYYTGNVDATDGSHFGYQLTFFRQAVTPNLTPRSSDLATNQVYFAHFAITDVKNNDHFVAERFSRGAADLAGASGSPYKVWLENWQVTSLAPDGSRVQLRASDSNHAIDLTLDPTKPLVLEGDAGLSQKSQAAGNASYYYSYTRLATAGTLTVDGRTYTVQGNSWMDHEFGTTSLSGNAVGWDWFAGQLSDQRELMYFQIRNKDGSIDPFSGGTLVAPDGTPQPVKASDIKLQVLGTWKSKLNANYPSQWKLSIPSQGLDLTIKPYIADQEMRVSIPYWEGAVAISGKWNGSPVQGNGYVEMTGYVPNAVAPMR